MVYKVGYFTKNGIRKGKSRKDQTPTWLCSYSGVKAGVGLEMISPPKSSMGNFNWGPGWVTTLFLGLDG